MVTPPPSTDSIGVRFNPRTQDMLKASIRGGRPLGGCWTSQARNALVLAFSVFWPRSSCPRSDDSVLLKAEQRSAAVLNNPKYTNSERILFFSLQTLRLFMVVI